METSILTLVLASLVLISTVLCLPYGDSNDAHTAISEVTFTLNRDGEVKKVSTGSPSTPQSKEEVTNSPPPGLSMEDIVALTRHQVSSSESALSDVASSEGGELDSFQDQSGGRMSGDSTPTFGALAADTGDMKSDDCYNDTFDPISNFGKESETDYIVDTGSTSYGVPSPSAVNVDFYVPPEAVKGKYGGFYRDYHLAENGIVHPFETNIAYLHGKYREPTENYYDQYVHNSTDSSALGYYLGLGLRDLYNGQRIEQTYTTNHYHHQENPNKPQRFATDRPERQTEHIPPEVIAECNSLVESLCPENTEAFCLRNGTIMCMSAMSALRVCDSYPEMSCVDTVVPCVPGTTQLCVGNLETIAMPCLTKLVMDLPKGGMLLRVAKTFVVASQPPEETRSYCAMIIFEPLPYQYE